MTPVAVVKWFDGIDRRNHSGDPMLTDMQLKALKATGKIYKVADQQPHSLVLELQRLPRPHGLRYCRTSCLH